MQGISETPLKIKSKDDILTLANLYYSKKDKNGLEKMKKTLYQDTKGEFYRFKGIDEKNKKVRIMHVQRTKIHLDGNFIKNNYDQQTKDMKKSIEVGIALEQACLVRFEVGLQMQNRDCFEYG